MARPGVAAVAMILPDFVEVRGNATADEVAAVLAALSKRATDQAREPDRYERWRRTRLAAVSRA